MSFTADKQTLSDLNLLGKYRQDSIFSLFNKVKTRGGERLLESMFQHPLGDADQINERSGLFTYFQDKQLVFPFDSHRLNTADNYLNNQTAGSLLTSSAGVLRKKLLQSLLKDERYAVLIEGLVAAIELLNRLKDLIGTLVQDEQAPFRTQAQAMNTLFGDARLSWLSSERDMKEIPVLRVARYDHLLRNVLRREMEAAMEVIYQMDVYIAISDVARARQFTYAKALHPNERLFRSSALSHPALEKGVANPLTLSDSGNVLFLTGANMAGKSTFMKAFGIAVYMAHMGFPVAAGEMSFSVREGLFTSINVSDNLSLGYSHFYAEVSRVKKVAEEVSRGKNLIVVFDELFKGTNVKDAYDATLSITQAFSKYRACLFVISTHIIEVGEALREEGDHFRFRYMPTRMNGKVPEYTYLLTEGITTDRQGMTIISNEGILDIIRGN